MGPKGYREALVAHQARFMAANQKLQALESRRPAWIDPNGPNPPELGGEWQHARSAAQQEVVEAMRMLHLAEDQYWDLTPEGVAEPKIEFPREPKDDPIPYWMPDAGLPGGHDIQLEGKVLAGDRDAMLVTLQAAWPFAVVEVGGGVD